MPACPPRIAGHPPPAVHRRRPPPFCRRTSRRRCRSALGWRTTLVRGAPPRPSLAPRRRRRSLRLAAACCRVAGGHPAPPARPPLSCRHVLSSLLRRLPQLLHGLHSPGHGRLHRGLLPGVHPGAAEGQLAEPLSGRGAGGGAAPQRARAVRSRPSHTAPHRVFRRLFRALKPNSKLCSPENPICFHAVRGCGARGPPTTRVPRTL